MILRHKILRDFRASKGAYIASVMVISVGLMFYTSMGSVVEGLEQTQKDFYSNQNFAHGFVQVESMPKSDINRLKSIKGIEEVQGRIVKDVLIHRPGAKENAFLRFVSMDLTKEELINGVHMEKGIPLEEGQAKVWLDSKFFEANHFELGDEVKIIADGKVKGMTVVGAGKSPEFVYTLRQAGDLFPSPETFGIAFVSFETAERLFSGSAINDLVFTLKAGADYDSVEKELESILKPYGIKAIYPREDQVSHIFLREKIDGVKSMTKVVPIMYLAFAAMILYITLKRLIEQQRGQIGILKAQGFTPGEIIRHYLEYALTAGIAGGLLGGAAGAMLAHPIFRMLGEFFAMPDSRADFPAYRFLFGVILSSAFSLIAGYFGCKGILVLEPAQAMRPPVPSEGKRVIFERINFLWNKLKVQNMMALRNLSRNPGRNGLIFSGVIICYAISSFTLSMNDIVDKLVYEQYEKVEVYDVKIRMNRPVNEKESIREIKAFEGVTKAQAIAEVPVTLRNRWKVKDVVLLGLPRGGELYRIYDTSYTKVEPPSRGILLSERLSEVLAAEVGTIIEVESPLKAGEERGYIEVAGIIPQYIGINAYMEIGSLQSLLRQKDIATSLIVNLDADGIDSLREKYISSNIVASIDERGQRLQKLKDLMATYGKITYIYTLMGAVIGFAIIYSSSTVALSERSRELASMMVLGMTHREVFSAVTLEQWIVALPAMLMGIPLSKLLMSVLAKSFSNDLYTIPARLSFIALSSAFVSTGLSIWIAQRIAAGKIKGLKLPEVLKYGE